MNCSFAHSLWFSSFFCLMSPPSPWMKFTFLGSTHAYLETHFFLPSWLSAETWIWHPDGSPGRTWNKIRNFIEFMRKFLKTKKLHFYKWVSIFQDMEYSPCFWSIQTLLTWMSKQTICFKDTNHVERLVMLLPESSQQEEMTVESRPAPRDPILPLPAAAPLWNATPLNRHKASTVPLQTQMHQEIASSMSTH